jgi:DNA-binding SARP family transcriptional activator
MTVAYSESPQTATNVVYLLGDPYVMQGGRRYVVPEGCKRLLAFVALQGGRADRRHAAGSLWPVGSEDRASGNLRSALWRLRGAGIDVLESDKVSIYLREWTTTDLEALCEWADRLIAGTATEADLHVPDWTTTVAELLPGWYDEWVIFERERIRQRMLHALEVLSRTLRDAGRYGEAIDAAMDAVAVEPLRETAHRALAEAHFAEGNVIEARRAFLRYRDLARRDLGVEPSAAFQEWLRSSVIATWTRPNGELRTKPRPARTAQPSAPGSRAGLSTARV